MMTIVDNQLQYQEVQRLGFSEMPFFFLHLILKKVCYFFFIYQAERPFR